MSLAVRIDVGLV